MKVAGIGCRKGVRAAQVVAAVNAALARHGLRRQALGGLAVVPAKAAEPAVAEAARLLGLPLWVAGEAALAAAGPRVLGRSPRSQAATGTASASEAAALALAGPGGRLLGPRLALGPVTCAIAAGEAPW